MIVVDATAVVNGLLRRGASRERVERDELHVPHLCDSEVLNSLSRLVRARLIDRPGAEQALDRWLSFGMRRYPVRRLMPRMWELRANVTAYDASYVALAEQLALPLVTGDVRLARAPGLRCDVVLLDD